MNSKVILFLHLHFKKRNTFPLQYPVFCRSVVQRNLISHYIHIESEQYSYTNTRAVNNAIFSLKKHFLKSKPQPLPKGHKAISGA